MRVPPALSALLLVAAITAWSILAPTTDRGTPQPAGPPLARPTATALAPTITPTGRSARLDPLDCYYARLHASDDISHAFVRAMETVAEVPDERFQNHDCGDWSP